MNTADVKRIIEAVLLCAQQPMPVAELRRMFADDVEVGADTVRALLDELRADWQGRAVALVALAGGWRFQSGPEVARYIERLRPERVPKYSRAVLETLAIIAYRQPVTRGDIEAIRGVSVASTIVKTLEDRGWVEVIGHKDVVGRPSLFATTRQFLDDLGLRSIQELPGLDAAATADAIGQQLIALAAPGPQPVVPMPHEPMPLGLMPPGPIPPGLMPQPAASMPPAPAAPPAEAIPPFSDLPVSVFVPDSNSDSNPDSNLEASSASVPAAEQPTPSTPARD
jgi:segregation and condensation protein B